MASISKRASGAWQNTSYGIRGTASDTITTLPTTIYSDGTNATVSIKGNTIQSGTPTPENPVIPQGCGELDSGQYKIPISSASTTTPVYLGEVETTRKIKKLVLDGTENFDHYGSGVFWVKVEDNNAMINEYGVSNSYVFNPVILNVPTTIANNEFCLTSANGRLWIRNTNYSNADGLKAYLAAQYAAGTPVTVWYVLAEPTTGIVNEPLMKIEDYADVVNNISIPTTDGANTLSVDTTVQPSEVSVNYHGWHMGTVHERTAGQWD